MGEIEQFLEPILGSNSAGEDLRYSPLYDKIREARRREDPGTVQKLDLGVEAKAADFTQVIKLAEDALLKKTKDLQIVAWVAEAWIHRDGISGLTSGLQLSRGLMERFWENLYPQLEDGDAELRARPLDWLGSYFDPGKGSSPILAVRSVPLTKSKFNWFTYQDSRKIGYEADVSGNKARVEAREVAIEEKKVTPEQFDKDFEATDKPFYKKLESDFKAAMEVLDEFDRLSSEKFVDVAPSFTPLRKALEEVGNVAHILLLKKLEKEPDPPETAENGSAAAESAASGSLTPGGTATQTEIPQLEAGNISSADQALLHVVAAARFIRQNTPSSPVSYLLLRAVRWGEVRSSGEGGLTNLPAPAPEVRMTLKASASGNNWKRVLETAETAMGSTIGRGWLDLQRYSIKACDELGYSATAKALRSELKALLADFPQLPNTTLNDDTGTANPETIAWLHQEGLAG